MKSVKIGIVINLYFKTNPIVRLEYFLNEKESEALSKTGFNGIEDETVKIWTTGYMQEIETEIKTAK